MAEKNYYKKKQFVFNGKTNPPEIWSSLSSKRYCFSSDYWIIYTRKYTAPLDTSFGMKIFAGEAETSDGNVYDWFMNEDQTFLINAPTRIYVENFDKCPVPKYVLSKIREIYNNLKIDELYYTN